ncbi:MAG: hypothetical protein IR160_09415 [Salinibacterium sp.]|nr:hypothetical protein [Salinibacterium sp.]MBF0672789.1 hypothetical protein [Salinibacterium sp.]
MDSGRSIPSIMLNRNALATGSANLLRSGIRSGEYVRVRPGAYVAREDREGASDDELYRQRMLAAAASARRPLVFSHDSAANMWGLPGVGAWPPRVHLLAPRDTGGRSHGDIQRHCLGDDPHAVVIDGIRVTSLARTLVDVACTSTFMRAVAMIDSGLRMPRSGETRWNLGRAHTTSDELRAVLNGLLPYPGSAKAFKAIEFGDGLSGSALESVSRVQMHLLGVPAPELQVAFSDADGHIGDADFYWRHLDLIGESDGKAKYAGREASPSGKSAEQVLWEEKQREDRMRAVTSGFLRWDWSTAISRHRFAATMRKHGLLPG